MTTSTIEYASTRTTVREFRAIDLVLSIITSAVFIGTLSAPVVFIDRLKNLFDDFKLKLPPATQLYLNVYDGLSTLYAQYWIWLALVFVPFWLLRMQPASRQRLLLVGVLFCCISVVVTVFVIVMPIFSLIEGMTGR